jgi:hypothetical protein
MQNYCQKTFHKSHDKKSPDGALIGNLRPSPDYLATSANDTWQNAANQI